MSTIDTLGMIALVKALEQPCECEQHQNRVECSDEPLNRWWRLFIADRHDLGERFSPEARRSA